MSSKGPPSSGPAEGASKVKAACEECRTRKTKCDGVRPTCGRCKSKARVCIFETEPDEFRMTALKRRYTELALSASNNETLIRLLREQEQSEVDGIVARLRSGESVESILAASAVSGPEKEAEKNLIAAVEEASTSDQTESSRSTTSQGQGAEEGPPTQRSPERRLVNKQSIAFMMGTQNSAPTPDAPDHVSQLPTDDSSNSNPNDRPHSTFARPARDSKRTRTSQPARPALRGPTISAPPSQTPGGSGFAEVLTRRPKTQDRSWTKELDGIKAADWDVYYADDETFLEILRCYFTWENPSLGFVNEAAFWEGLKNGGSDFCNHPLVHSILAFGSKIYGMFNPTRAASATHFALVEVTKMWDWDTDAKVPANASAGLLIHAIMTSNGQEKDGSPYIAGAMNLATQTHLFSKDRIATAYPDSDSKLAQERAAWAWDTYAYHGYYTLTFNEAFMIAESPPISAPDIDPNEDVKEWTPYPLQGAPRPNLASSFSRARARLWQIGSQIRPVHREYEHDSGSESHWNKAMEIYHRLSGWRNGLSTRLNSLNGSAAPHVFTLHSEYHRCIIDLSKPFVSPLKTDTNREHCERAKRLSNESHLQLRSLVHQYDTEFPGSPIPLKMLLNPLLYVVNETLPSLTRRGEASDEALLFDLCIKMMDRMQDVYPLMRFLILDIAEVAERQTVELPRASREIAQRLLKGRSATLPLNSAYPGDRQRTTATEGSHLERLIGSTQRLSLAHFGEEYGREG